MPLHLEMVTKMATMYKVAQSQNPKTLYFSFKSKCYKKYLTRPPFFP